MENNNQPDFSYIKQSALIPELEPIIQDLRTKNPQFNPSLGQQSSLPSLLDITNSKVDTKKSGFEEVDYLDVYKPLISGEGISMYETYVPGTNNQERLAANQSTGEKWANGLQKFGVKTATAVLGGTYGVVHGLGAAISDGSMSSIYDNNFSNWMNDLDTKLNYQLPNYYSKQEEDSGVFGQMGTANFWSDKFLGGLSFTTGAIISEGIWGWATGGTSLATAGARLGTKIAKLGKVGTWATSNLGEAATLAGMTKMKGLYKALDTSADAVNLGVNSRRLANTLGKAGEIASIAGRTVRSAGYEASVEALQYKKEAEENFYRNFADLNGREPNAEDISKFEVENESSANAVFGANMAIVSTSNFIGLGHVLNIKNPVNLGITDFINRKAFGYGFNKATQTVVKGTMGQKIARNAFDYLVKPSVTEGLFEEGLQGVTNKTANKWIEHTYNPKNTNETFSGMEAFSESLAEQYGSKEGWKENMLGILIGIAGGSVNVRGAQKEKEKEGAFQEAVAKTFDTQTLQSMILPHRVQTANRIAGFSNDAKEEEAQGNFSKSQVAKIGATTAFVNSKLVLGESISDMTSEMQNALNSMTAEQWKDAGVEQENIEQEKEERITEFKNVAKAWKTNKEYVQYMVGSRLVGEKDLDTTVLESTYGSFSKNAQVVEALTWQLTVGEQSGKIIKDVTAKVGEEIGEEHARTITTINELERQTPQQRKEIAKLRAQTFANRALRDNITKRILDLDKLSAQTESQKLSRNKLSVSLVEAENKARESEQKLQEIADKITASKTYKKDLDAITISQDLLTGQDLLNLEENIGKFRDVVSQQEQLDPQRASYLKDLMKEHSDANAMFLQAQATQKAFASPEFKIGNIDGWMSNLFNKSKSMNENTQAWFQDSIEKYDKFKVDSLSILSEKVIEGSEAVTDSQYTEFTESGEVPSEVLQKIATKYRATQNNDFTKEEQEIFNSKKQEIEDIIREENTKSQPKSQEQINQEKIDALEAERTQKLAEVEDLEEKITSEVEVSLSEEDKARLENIPLEIQNLKNRTVRLTNEIESLDNPQETDPLVDAFAKENNDDTLDYKKADFQGNEVIIYNTNQPNDWGGKGSSFKQTWNVLKFNQGTFAHVRLLMTSEQKEQYDSKATTGFSKELRDLAKNNRDSDNVVLIDIRPKRYNSLDIQKQQNTLKEEIENINDKVSQLEDTLERSKQKEGVTTQTITTTKNTPNQLEIDKINNEYDEKVNALKPSKEDRISQYKKRIDRMFNELYDDLIPTEDLEADRPTKEEIEQYKTNPTEKLKKKLQNWQLLDNSTDDGYTSIVDLLDNIAQQETEIEQEITKDEVTEKEALEDLVSTEGTGLGDRKDIPNNSTEPVTAKRLKGTNVIQLTHLKARHIVEQIGEDYRIKRGKKYVAEPDIDKMQPKDIVEIDGMTFTMDENYRLELKEADLNSRKQQLNIYLEESQSRLNFISVYTILGNEKVKMPSQFTDANLIEAKNASFNIKVGDKLTLHVGDNKGWNKTAKGGTLEEFTIYLKDKAGNIVYNLKSGKAKYGEKTDENFLNLRRLAYKNWEFQGKPDTMSLGISVEVKEVFLGSPELLFSQGELVDGDISLQETDVIVAKGYIQNGKITLDTEIKDVSKAYVGRLTKNNPSLKIPIVVFKVGVNMVAFPVTLKKTTSPVEFDALLQGTPQEIVKKINQSIIDNKVKTDKLNFSDITLDYNGEIVMSPTAKKAKENFAKKTTFVSADTLATAEYNKENLAKDASIRIDLSDLKKIFSAPKIVIDVKNADLKTNTEIKYDTMANLEEKLNTLFQQIHRTYSNDYKDENGEIIENNSFAQKLANSIPYLRLEPGKDSTLKRANIKILQDIMSVVPKSFTNIFGTEKIEETKRLLKEYESVKKIKIEQVETKTEEVEKGLNNIC